MNGNESAQEGEKPGFLGGMVEKVTGVFKKEDGGMNWGSIIGMAAGGALAMFAGPMLGIGEGIMGMLLPVIGAVAGLFIGKSLGDNKKEEAPVESPNIPRGRTIAAGAEPRIERPQGLPTAAPQRSQSSAR